MEKEEGSLESKPSDGSAGLFLELRKHWEPPEQEKMRWIFPIYLPETK